MRSRMTATYKNLKQITIFIILLLNVNNVLGQEYASMFILYGDQETKNLPVNNWHKVGSGAAQFNPGPMTSWRLEDQNMLSAKQGGSGDYLLRYDLSFLGSEGDWKIGILLNDSLLNASVRVHLKGTSARRVNVDLTTLVSIQTGDCISMVVRPESGPGNFTAVEAVVNLSEIRNAPLENGDDGGFAMTVEDLHELADLASAW